MTGSKLTLADFLRAETRRGAQAGVEPSCRGVAIDTGESVVT